MFVKRLIVAASFFLFSYTLLADTRSAICLNFQLEEGCLEELGIEEKDLWDVSKVGKPNRKALPLPAYHPQTLSLLFDVYDPQELHFMQSSVSPLFRDGRSVIQTALDLKRMVIGVSELPRLSAWMDRDDKIWTLDHRRLVAIHLSQRNEAWVVPGHLKKVKKEAFKFTTTSQGEWIDLLLPFDKVLRIYRQ